MRTHLLLLLASVILIVRVNASAYHDDDDRLGHNTGNSGTGRKGSSDWKRHQPIYEGRDGESFTVISHESWFQRMGNDGIGAILGLILTLVAPCILFYNEKRTLRTSEAIEEAQKKARSVNGPASLSLDTCDTLVHVQGVAQSADASASPVVPGFEHSLRFPGALLIKCDAEAYQWVEEVSSTSEKEMGGGAKVRKTFTYKKQWMPRFVSSSSFQQPSGHQNESLGGGLPPLGSQQHRTPAPVTLNGFELPEELLNKMCNWEPLRELVSHTNDVCADLSQRGYRQVEVSDNIIYVFPASASRYEASIASPPTNTVRLTFSILRAAPVSVLARHVHHSAVSSPDHHALERYVASNGYPILALHMGTKSLRDMADAEASSNLILAWLLRGLGFLLCWLGLYLGAKPIGTFLDLFTINFFGLFKMEPGTIVNYLSSMATFVIALCISFVTIAIAWLFYRPMTALLLLLAAGSAVYFLRSANTVPQRA